MMSRSQFGLTTLIIFIALIVTAAVAAGVIIYTTQTMQQQALQTGAQAKQRVSTGLEAIRVLGYQFNTSSGILDQKLQKVTAVAPLIRLMSGSNPINFNAITVLISTEKEDFYSITLKSTIPVALHGKLEGGKVLITGFIYNNSVESTTTGYTITDSAVCSKLYNNTYVVSDSSVAPCHVKLNASKIAEPLDIQEVFKALEEMRDYGVTTPSILIALTMKNQNMYIDSGEIYEWVMLLERPLVPEEKYAIQIIPKNGYVTQVDGVVPSVLQAPVLDIWAK